MTIKYLVIRNQEIISVIVYCENVNDTDANGRAPLCYAWMNSRLQDVQYLAQ